MGNPVVHFEFYAKDMKAQSSFYAETFGWETKTCEESGCVMFSASAAAEFRWTANRKG